MKVILAHDSFTQYGGAERVFEGMHELYPQEPVYTLVTDKKITALLTGWRFVVSPLQWVYKIYPRFQHLFPFIPIVMALFRTEKADILLSSSSAYIKGITTRRGTIHINYCHTPTRFVWMKDTQYAIDAVTPILRPLARAYLRWLKRWDWKKAQRVDYFIANSKEVQARIQRYYKRDSIIINPFIDLSFWKSTRSKQDYFLIAGRLAPYKRHDLVIRLFNELQWPLHIVGSGSVEAELRAIAGPTITFLGRVDDATLRDEFSGARGFIYPQMEDFGIMPLEAAACGTATIGLASGGSLETIIAGKTGELIAGLDEDNLRQALLNWNPEIYTASALREHAVSFGKERFQQQVQKYVEDIYYEHSN